jgi:adenylosuccinate synthase
MRDVTLICDLQYGSTGKGQIAGAVARTWEPDTVATAWGPNAGHTFRDGPLKFVSTMLATSALAPSVKTILIGPGSVVNVEALKREIDAAATLLNGKELVIHPNATILGPLDAELEAHTLERIGSTMKGTAEAMIRKIRREPDAIARTKSGEVGLALLDTLGKTQMALAISEKRYDEAIDASRRMLVEGAQGYSLGIHTQFYPHCTSRDISPSQTLADCRIPHQFVNVIGVARTYPIRVANRVRDGVQVGSSGPCYPDQEEITWESLGREPELTTVTKLPRRIFTLSDEQLRQAARLCNPQLIALTFMDYVRHVPEPGDCFESVDNDLYYRVEQATKTPVLLSSWGPDTQQVYRHEMGSYTALDKKAWNDL